MPRSPSAQRNRTGQSVEYREFLNELSSARKILPRVAPAVIVPGIICYGGDLIPHRSNLSLLIFCMFCCIAAYSSEPAHVAKSFVYLTYGALFALNAGRAVSDLVGLVILNLVCMLAAFLLGAALLRTESNSTRKILPQRRSPLPHDLPLRIVRTIAHTLPLPKAANCLWFATPSVFILGSLIPKSRLVAGHVLFLCTILYSTSLGYCLRLTIIGNLSSLRVATYNLFLDYRRKLQLKEEHPQEGQNTPMRQYDTLQQVPVTVAGGGLIIALLWFSHILPVFPTHILSLVITTVLFFCILYYSRKDTQLSKIFFSLSYTCLVGFSAGDVLGMLIMITDSLLAAALFGVTLAQHRLGERIERADTVAVANANLQKKKKQNRRPAYYMIGFLALCYLPRLVWLIFIDRPALDVTVSFFGSIAFLQVIYISCIIGWLNGAIFDSSVPIFIYFASVAWIFVSAYLLFGEAVSLAVLWSCILASTSFLGYYSQVHSSYEKKLIISFAEKDIRKAIDYYNQNVGPHGQINIYRYLTDVYAAQKDILEAIDYYNQDAGPDDQINIDRINIYQYLTDAGYAAHAITGAQLAMGETGHGRRQERSSASDEESQKGLDFERSVSSPAGNSPTKASFTKSTPT